MKFKVLILVLFLLAGVYLPAAASTGRKVVLAGDGTIYLVEQGTRRGFPSAEVFFSHGYTFGDARTATAEDLALTPGAVMTYAEGALAKGTDQTVFIISDGKKRPFTSGQVFLGLGYSFGNVLKDSGNLLSGIVLGDVVNSATAAHPSGSLVNDGGTVYLVTPNGKKGISSVEVFDSHRYSFKNVVAANAADRALADQGLLAMAGTEVPAPTPTPSPPPPQPPPPVPYPPPPSNNAPSVPTISGVTGTFPVTSETFQISSTDPEGDIITYTVNWGDNSTDTRSLSSGATLTLTHSWQYIGEYTIVVKAEDSKGAASSKNYPIKVNTDTAVFGPAVTILTPNGGGSYKQSDVVKITWRRNWMPQQAFGKVDIYYRQGSGANRLIKSGVLDGSHDWVPIDLQPADDYKIVILSNGSPGGGTIDDSSDNVFSIVSQ